MRKIELAGDWKDFDFAKVSGWGKTACVVRYGAYGDVIQTSSVFPALKEQGYQLTVNVSERGHDILREDPHIDTLFIQKTDHVPNAELGQYWNKMSSYFSKFINFSESIERTLLPWPTDKLGVWPREFRHMVTNVDYFDALHAIAGCLDYPKRPKFYPTKAEDRDAQQFRNRLGNKNRVILWAISGTSIHKIWPYLDIVFARLMLQYDDVKIVMVGGELEKMIERPWKNEKRIIRKSGKWSIRETLSFLPYTDLIVGPETGVLNAASFLDVPKILFLSHSSKENIGGSWKNTKVFEPKNVPCYPCHLLHYGFSTCNRDFETGTALCAAKIDVEDVYSEIKRILDR